MQAAQYNVRAWKKFATFEVFYPKVGYSDCHQGNVGLGFTLAGALLLFFLLYSCQ